MADETTQATQAAKPPKDEKNGIVRPAAGTLIHKVWQTAEDLSATLGRPATRSEVRDAIGDSVNPATTATQYARWTKYHGVSNLIKQHRANEAGARKAESDKAKADAKAQREAAKAAKQQDDEAKAKAAQDKADAAAKKAADKDAAAKAKAEAKAAADAKKAEDKAAKDKAKADAKAAADAKKAADKAAKDAAKQQEGQQAAA